MVREVKYGLFFVLGMLYMLCISYTKGNLDTLFTNEAAPLQIIAFVIALAISVVMLALCCNTLYLHWNDDK